MIAFKFTERKLIQLAAAADEVIKQEDPNAEPLTPELLDKLIERFFTYLLNSAYHPDELFEEYSPRLCGCLGPMDGEPYCSCAMNRLIYKYRYRIALAIVQKDCTIK